MTEPGRRHLASRVTRVDPQVLAALRARQVRMTVTQGRPVPMTKVVLALLLEPRIPIADEEPRPPIPKHQQ
jgi:hypothetical protein